MRSYELQDSMNEKGQLPTINSISMEKNYLNVYILQKMAGYATPTPAYLWTHFIIVIVQYLFLFFSFQEAIGDTTNILQNMDTYHNVSIISNTTNTTAPLIKTRLFMDFIYDFDFLQSTVRKREILIIAVVILFFRISKLRYIIKQLYLVSTPLYRFNIWSNILLSNFVTILMSSYIFITDNIVDLVLNLVGIVFIEEMDEFICNDEVDLITMDNNLLAYTNTQKIAAVISAILTLTSPIVFLTIAYTHE